MKKIGDKYGQIKLSFGMIFSIILIIIFIAFAFYAIKMFLDFRDSTNVKLFFDDLQTDVDKMWRSTQGSQEGEYRVVKSADLVCFVDFNSGSTARDDIYNELELISTGDNNFFVYPGKGDNGFQMAHIDIEKITSEKNPYCINVVNGKAKLIIKKDYGESLVVVS